MNTQPLRIIWAGYRDLPALSQIGLVAGLLLLILGITAAVGGWISRRADARFDAAQAEAAEERRKLQSERDRAIETAVAAEAAALEVEAQLTRDRTDDQAAARAVVAADKAAERIAHDTDQEVARVLADDDASPDERRARIRAILQRTADGR